MSLELFLSGQGGWIGQREVRPSYEPAVGVWFAWLVMSCGCTRHKLCVCTSVLLYALFGDFFFYLVLGGRQKGCQSNTSTERVGLM